MKIKRRNPSYKPFTFKGCGTSATKLFGFDSLSLGEIGFTLLQPGVSWAENSSSFQIT